jgi:hypothetical protein
MKKLQIYNLETAIDFFLDVVQRKNSGQYSQWPSTALNNHIRSLFDDYDTKLKSNTLEQLLSIVWQGVDETNFKDLYSFDAKKFRDLYQFLTTTPNNVVDKVCPYCYLDTSESLDHYVPKTPFPHFSANPQNLIPCCSECNSKKKDFWRANQRGKNVRLFLNAYIDDVMNQNFLQVAFSYPNNNIVPSFSISQNGMPQNLFDIVETHFAKLNLATRYKDNSNEVIVELGNSIKAARKNGLTDQMIKKINLDTIAENERTFGLNHWKTVLKKECINDPDAYDFLATH